MVYCGSMGVALKWFPDKRGLFIMLALCSTLIAIAPGLEGQRLILQAVAALSE